MTKRLKALTWTAVEYQAVIGNGFRFQQINWANDPKYVQYLLLTPVTS